MNNKSLQEVLEALKEFEVNLPNIDLSNIIELSKKISQIGESLKVAIDNLPKYDFRDIQDQISKNLQIDRSKINTFTRTSIPNYSKNYFYQSGLNDEDYFIIYLN